MNTLSPPPRTEPGPRVQTRAVPIGGGSSSIVASAALFVAFIAVTVVVAQGRTDVFDAQLLQWVQGHLRSPLVPFWETISWPGYAPESFGVAAIAVYLGWGYAGRRGLILMLIALTAQGFGTIVKDLVARPRPTPESAIVTGPLMHSFSYPSGHVVTYTAILGLLALLIVDALPTGGWVRKRDQALCALCVALIVFIGPSRVALGQHWPMDALGGYLLGGTLLALLARWRRPG